MKFRGSRTICQKRTGVSSRAACAAAPQPDAGAIFGVGNTMDHEKPIETPPGDRRSSVLRQRNRVLALGLAAVAATVLVVAVTAAITLHDVAAGHALSTL
jgi:hypothetical protein